MTRITNTDQVILLLRNQLQRMDKSRKKRAQRSKTGDKDIQKTPLERVSSMSSEDTLSETEIHRALISGILTEEFGTEVSNDPAFQKLIDDVLTTISHDTQSQELLSDAMKQITQKPK